MYVVGKCYKCGEWIAFLRVQKSVKCSKCNKVLRVSKVLWNKHYFVDDARTASEIIKKFHESQGNSGFFTFK